MNNYICISTYICTRSIIITYIQSTVFSYTKCACIYGCNKYFFRLIFKKNNKMFYFEDLVEEHSKKLGLDKKL